jgi:trk system potassium uptake protein
MPILTSPTWYRPSAKPLVRMMNILLLVVLLASAGTLVLAYGGFSLSDSARRLLYGAQTGVMVLFMLDRLARLFLARDGASYFRQHMADFILIGLAVGFVIVTWIFRGQSRQTVASLGAVYVLLTQVFLIVSLILQAVKLNMLLAGSSFPPTRLLVASFAFLVVLGTGLLMLPAATPESTPIGLEDATFTAVSAVCVTGLIVRDTGSDFTLFGQSVILVLIQLGGLGIMLFGTAVAMALGRGRLDSRATSTMAEMLSESQPGRVRRMMRFVILATLLLEAAGAAMLFPMFRAAASGLDLSTGQAVWFSVFHSVSAFCNAGFSLMSNNLAATGIRDYWQVMGMFAPLIILGGLGFPVLYDVMSWIVRQVRRWMLMHRANVGAAAKLPGRPVLTLHSKLVLVTTICLLVLGTLGLIATEMLTNSDTMSDWKSLPKPAVVREAAFLSVSARTAGFNTTDMADVSPSGKLLVSGLMLVGGSPASTAGGMKTVVLAVLVLAVTSSFFKRRDVEVFHRRIANTLFRHAAVIAFLYLTLVGMVTFCLTLALGDQFGLVDLFFEACSACGTVGLSTGVTGSLTGGTKGVIILAMFIGRLGPMTMLLALNNRFQQVEYSYPEGHVIIG